jgi:hypothetical protein
MQVLNQADFRDMLTPHSSTPIAKKMVVQGLLKYTGFRFDPCLVNYTANKCEHFKVG